MMLRKGGSGEAGVHIRSREKYHQPVTTTTIPIYAEASCQFYRVGVPSIEVVPSVRRRWGTYHTSKLSRVPFGFEGGRVRLNYPILGVLLHELAHHITWQVYHVNGHGPRFKAVLNNLFEWWQV